MSNYPKNRKRGSGLSNKGIIRSLEFRQKVSTSMKKLIHTPEHNTNVSKALMGNSIRGKGWHHPSEVCKVMSIKKMGELNPNWKGGIYKTNRDVRRSPIYKRWQISIYKRDKYRCQLCGGSNNLNANHIKRFSEYPELRFEISNGITLCFNCHKAIRGKENEWENRFTLMLEGGR